MRNEGRGQDLKPVDDFKKDKKAEKAEKAQKKPTKELVNVLIADQNEQRRMREK